jgi:hypothetical protein
LKEIELFLRSLSDELRKLTKELDELTGDLEDIVRSYEAYKKVCSEPKKPEYIYKCLSCKHRFWREGACPRCGSLCIEKVPKW